MKKFVIFVALLAAVGYGSSRYVTIYKANIDLAERVENHLDDINPSSIPAVQKAVIEDAGKLGVTLTPANVTVLCAPTEDKTYAQKLVVKKVGVEFVNLNTAINVEYTANFFGLGLKQKIEKSRIKQLSGTAAHNAELEKVLEDKP